MDEAAGAPGAGGGFPGGASGVPGYGGGAPAYGTGRPGDAEEAFYQPSSAPLNPRPANFHRASLSLLVVLPVAVFVSISLCYCFVYHQKPAVIWAITGFCLCLSTLFALAPQKQSGPRFWRNVGLLVLLATAVGNVVGQWNYRRHVLLYWAYEGQREYTNVSPKELALTHLDAGKLIFSQDTVVDRALTVGTTVGADRLCVAPILAATADDPKTHPIQYWAAGINCCGTEDAQQFNCDDALDKQAHSGLVFLDYGPRRALLDSFMKAAKDAGVVHGIMPAEDALFVSWVADPDQVQAGYWRTGASFVAGESVIYLGFSMVLGFIFHFGPRSPTSRLKQQL